MSSSSDSDDWDPTQAGAVRSLNNLVATDTTWLYVYASTLFFSFVATMLAAYHMRALGGDVFRSTVHFVTTSFLICTSLHALAGGIFYSLLIASMNKWIRMVEKQYDADGYGDWPERHANANATDDDNNVVVPPAALGDWMSGSGSLSAMANTAAETLLTPDDHDDGAEAAFLTKLTHDHTALSRTLMTFLVLESIFFVLSAYWIFLLTRELYHLANKTLDRGSHHERRVIHIYATGALAILVGFLICGLVVVLNHSSGYNGAFRFIVLFELSAIILSVLYAWGALILLRAKGRKNEHIHGMLTASPLYRRLKLMVNVCAVFTLPYSILQVLLLAMSTDQVDDVPDYLVGLITTVYYVFGAAQALVMGGSQQCCFRLLSPILPTHIKNSPEWAALRATHRHDGHAGLHGSAPSFLEAAPPPQCPVFVNTDIESSSALWAQAPQHVIDEAQRIHDDLLRSTLPTFHGYEITTAGDAFQLAFHDMADAVGYCLSVQLALLHAKWPSELHGLVPSTRTEREPTLKCTTLFRGLRVRMGVHDTSVDEEGVLVLQDHPVTGKTVYIGASEMVGREVGDVGYGGQILVSKRVAMFLRRLQQQQLQQLHQDEGERKPETKTKPVITTPFLVDFYGSHAVRAVGLDVELYEVTPRALDGRRKLFKKRHELEDKNKDHAAVLAHAVTASNEAQQGHGNSNGRARGCGAVAESSPMRTLPLHSTTESSGGGGSGDEEMASVVEFHVHRSPRMRSHSGGSVEGMSSASERLW